MNLDDTIQSLWDCHDSGNYFPEEWKGKLSVDDAYRVQLGILAKKVERGARHAGWKVGLTANAIRGLYGASEPVFGYLLESGLRPSGHRFTADEIAVPFVESEVLVTMGADLPGPHATPEAAREAIATIAPAYEVPARRGGGLDVDFPLGIADNVSQEAYVAGEAIPLPAGLDFGEIRVEVEIDGEVTATAIGREVMDNQLDTLAWLANALTQYGARLQAGQRVLTGSFTKPEPGQPGKAYESRFSGLGAVRMSFA